MQGEQRKSSKTNGFLQGKGLQSSKALKMN